MVTKLCLGGGRLVAHSSERPQAHGSSTRTLGPCADVYTFQRNGSVGNASRNAPTVEIWLSVVQPSLDNLYVRAGARGRGVGELLMTELARQASPSRS